MFNAEQVRKLVTIIDRIERILAFVEAWMATKPAGFPDTPYAPPPMTPSSAPDGARVTEDDFVTWAARMFRDPSEFGRMTAALRNRGVTPVEFKMAAARMMEGLGYFIGSPPESASRNELNEVMESTLREMTKRAGDDRDTEGLLRSVLLRLWSNNSRARWLFGTVHTDSILDALTQQPGERRAVLVSALVNAAVAGGDTSDDARARATAIVELILR